MDRAEGKLLKELEEVNNLQCMITEPTQVTAHSESLLDVILTNNPELFKKCGVYQPEMSVWRNDGESPQTQDSHYHFPADKKY